LINRLYIFFTFIFTFLISETGFSQNETKKWYFGNQAGLDFNTNPPTILTNNTMTAVYSCASIADASGNLLFYTNGTTVYDQTHNVMANGTGLLGGSSSGSQGSIIIKQPGNTNLYYIFTTANCWNCTTGFNYSIVDMNLAAGNGSVTVKNANLFTGYSSGRLTATKHCNGVDVWVLMRDWFYTSSSTTTSTYTPNFRAYLLTTTGVSTTAIVSAPSTYTNSWSSSYYYYDWGCMKLSPNGKKLGLAIYNNYYSWNTNNNSNFELYDFDNTTGVVSNSLALQTVTNSTYYGGWGCEFSPDGTKFYGSNLYSGSSGLFQWDLCAGSPSAVAASIYTIVTNSSYNGSMQLAADGKIYSTVWNANNLGVINNPNGLGSACNYSAAGQSISPKTSYYSLPNFMASNFISRPPPTPFTYTANNTFGCQTATFNSTYNPSVTVVGCAASGYSLTNVQWNFGDPGSGASNTSTLQNPAHAYSTLGTYSVQLVLYYSCGGGTDTLKQVVVINDPCITVNSTSITCANLGSATVAANGGIGPFSYTWTPSGQTSSVATGLSPGNYVITVYDFGNNFTYTANTVFTSLVPLTGNINTTNSITCNGATTGTASVTNLSGGSGSTNYFWFNGIVTHTVSNPNTLSAGLWTVVASDALTGCLISQVFFISQPPPIAILMTANTQTACAGTSIVLNGSTSGGTPMSPGPGYTYLWSTGLASDTRTVSQSLAGNYIYTLSSQDSYSCTLTNTIAVDFIMNPVITITNTSICPLETGTLTASGASSYTWQTSLVSNTFTDNPMNTTTYTLIGTALGCTSNANGSIILKPLPSPLLNSNAPICNGQNLNLFGNVIGNTSATYNWTGPFGFVSTNQYPSVSNASPNYSGVYHYTVTAVNGCTAATSASLNVNPTPTVSAAGSTVCVNQTLLLFGSSVAGATYSWTGPGFNSNLQNPFVNSPLVAATGNYTLKVASAEGCTNIATTSASVTALPLPLIVSNSPRCFGETLNLTSSGGDTYQWLGPNGFSSIQANNQINNVTVPANGLYTLIVTRGPCTNQTTHYVTIHPLPTFTLSSNTPCETKTFSLFTTPVSNVINYVWQGPAGFGSQNQNPRRDSSITNYAGIYTLTVVDVNTCADSRTLAANILENPTVTASSATVCLNQSAELNGDGAVSYLWNGPNFYQSTKQIAFIPIATSSALTIYTLVGTAANNCTSVVTASLTTKSLPSPSLTVAPKTTICLNSGISMEGFGGSVYDWTGPGNFKFSGKVLSFTATSLAYTGTYTLTATDDKGCFNQTYTTIQVDPLPQGNLLGSLTDACTPFSSNFSFTSAGTIGPNIATVWTINDVFTKSGKNFTYEFNTPGEYNIVGSLTDTVSTCKNTLRFLVYAREVPKANFEYVPERPVENFDDVLFSNTSSGKELTKTNWYFMSNDGYTSSQTNTSYLFQNAGTYPVAMVVTNKWNCADTLVKTVKVETDFNVFVPNAFTPNEDKKNELFMPVLRGVTLYEFSVFNRWGERLFITRNFSEGWDGTYADVPCKSDLYVWKLVLTTTQGQQKFYNGSVTLYR
jgi:gliding motility-associated-like protein